MTIKAYKGFNTDMTCRGFQYELGKTYEHKGDVEACSSGFHACEHPLDVFRYYPPATSRFAAVAMDGETSKDGSDTKIAAAKITIEAELKLPDIIAAAVKWVFDRAKWTDGPVAVGPNEGATASGYGGAATASGYGGKVRGANGCALFLVQRDVNDKILHVWAGVVGRDGIKPDTWYTLKAGKPVEAK